MLWCRGRAHGRFTLFRHVVAPSPSQSQSTTTRRSASSAIARAVHVAGRSLLLAYARRKQSALICRLSIVLASRCETAPSVMPSSSVYSSPVSTALLLLAVYACTGGRWAAAQRAGSGIGYRVAPSVNIRRQGVVSGIEVPINKLRAWVYLGIPFARPPTGELRFAPPDVDPPPTWDGVRNGSQHRPGCMQNLPARTHPVRRIFNSIMPRMDMKTSEDCLYLNVYRPEGERE